MLTGIIFNIKEFAVHDGPGIRTTVHLKGCPLRCSWCHNPEGLYFEPSVLTGPRKRPVGTKYTSCELANIILEHEEFLKKNEGGVTFSGGEPLAQHNFLREVIDTLNKRLHVTLDTCGYGSEKDFQKIAEVSDLLLFDLKIMDESTHIKYTGKTNKCILQNFKTAVKMQKDVTVRVPLIPGITDTDNNLTAIAKFVSQFEEPTRVELLPYNKVAGAKYKLTGREYSPGFDESIPPRGNIKIFEKYDIDIILR